MKVFFFYTGTPTPVFETELELIRKHDRLGDTVRVLQCAGNLPNCHWNQKHDQWQCGACRSKFQNGWQVLRPGPNVELKQFPESRFEKGSLPDVFDSVDQIRSFQHDGANIGYGVASGLISNLRDHRFDTRLHRHAVARELHTAVHTYETLKREFEEFKPDRVYFFNGRIASQLPAVLLCRRLGIEYFMYEVANGSDNYMLMRNRTVHEAIPAAQLDRWRATWTEERRTIAENVIRHRRLGKAFMKVPAFTAEQVKGLLPVGFDASMRNIGIFNSTLDEYAGIEGWANRLYEPDETAGVGRILESFESDERFVFYLRVHPHMKEVPARTSQLEDIRKLDERYANLRVIWPADDVDSYALMDACEKIVTFGSTMGVEATYWGKPSILAGRAIYENLGCVYVPESHAELVTLVREPLKAMPAEAVLMYFHADVSEGVPFEHFKETGMRHGLATGTFDGVEIRSDTLPDVAKGISHFVRGAAGALAQPSQAWTKLKRYAKTFA